MSQTLAIKTDSLSKRFGSVRALDSVSFELPSDSFLSVFGPNGAGKSTLLRILATLARPTSGSAQLFGLNLKEDADSLRSQIGVLSHRSMLFPDLTAYENLLFFGRLYGLESPEYRVNEMLDLVEMTGRKHDAVRGFSRGMTQRVAIARALLHDPRLLLLDEPYSGLDPGAISLLDELLEQIRPGRTFIMVSHDLGHGFSLASHIMVLSRGRLVAFESCQGLNQQQFYDLYHQSIEIGK
ncbi:MAG: ABC transporter ATP-binding protein [Coriobacteriia bacterium]|nr:ABC transporter ATP-binding protein [Coriobacteriia bacterium]